MAYHGVRSRMGIPFSGILEEIRDHMIGERLLAEAIRTLNDRAIWSEYPTKTRNLINAFSIVYDRLIFKGARVSVFSSEHQEHQIPRYCFNCTELNHGMSFRFDLSGDARWTKEVGNWYQHFGPDRKEELDALRVADIVAASSCFPGGFEPMVFPRDFEDGVETRLRQALIDQDRRPLAEDKQPFCILDGGAVDNQGLYALRIETERRKRREQEPFDLLVSCDVSSFYVGRVVPADDKKAWRGGFSLKTWFWLSLLLVASIVSCAILTLREGQWLLFGLVSVPALVLLYAAHKVARLIWGGGAGGSWRTMFEKYGSSTLSGLSLGTVRYLFKARLDSVWLLLNDAFMTQIRRQQYGDIYDGEDGTPVISCMVYELASKNTETLDRRMNGKRERARNSGNEYLWGQLVDELVPSPAMIRVADSAASMPTTLWFDESNARKLDDLLACGRFTMCFNLLVHLAETECYRRPLSQDEMILRYGLLAQWRGFLENPFWSWRSDRTDGMSGYTAHVEKKRVTVYYMHEHELAAVSSLITGAERTKGYVMGELSERDIHMLRARGIVVVEAQHPDERHHKNAGPGSHTTTLPSTAPIDKDQTTASKEADYYLIWTKGPLTPGQRAKLDDVTGRPLVPFPHGAIRLFLNPTELERVKRMEFVDRLRLYETTDSSPDLLLSPKAPWERMTGLFRTTPTLTYDVLLDDVSSKPEFEAWLMKLNVKIIGSGPRKFRIEFKEDRALMRSINRRTEVVKFEEYVPPKLMNDRARVLVGVEKQTDPNGLFEYLGQGQLVGVADTGIDLAHPDFLNRVTAVGLGRPGVTTDLHGHGTHVAGSIAGDGTASSGALRGIAPKAKLFVQSLLDDKGKLGGLPVDLGKLFEEAYKKGARIHNNSWGSATGSRYTIDSLEVDEFVKDNPDMLIVISAGNEGTCVPAKGAPKGSVGWLSIGSPASSKNALTVGACRTDRDRLGHAHVTYGANWPECFPDPRIAGEMISGDPECMAGFSSRGPIDDHRIKPDVVAPGTDIASARASEAPSDNFTGPFPKNQKYAFMSGTSMAAPIVSGCAALVREYYVERRHHEPSAALLKATLVNGTQWLKGWDSIADHAFQPNYHQGFGRVNMPTTIPSQLNPELMLYFDDQWKNGQAGVLDTVNNARRFVITVTQECPELRICMAYTDPGARALQNHVFLLVEPGQYRRKIYGNEQVPLRIIADGPDLNNNVQIVRVLDAEPGDYTINVVADNLLRTTEQSFALVVTGYHLTPLTETPIT